MAPPLGQVDQSGAVEHCDGKPQRRPRPRPPLRVHPTRDLLPGVVEHHSPAGAEVHHSPESGVEVHRRHGHLRRHSQPVLRQPCAPILLPGAAEHHSPESGAEVHRSPAGAAEHRSPAGVEVHRSPAGAVEHHSPAGVEVHHSPAGAEGHHSPESGAEEHHSPAGVDSPAGVEAHRSPAGADTAQILQRRPRRAVSWETTPAPGGVKGLTRRSVARLGRIGHVGSNTYG